MENENIISELVAQNYEDNMLFFKNEALDLYNKLFLFDLAISTNQYSPKYELEYKEDSSSFDIFDNKSKKLIYNNSSLEHAKEQVKNVTFDNYNHNFNPYYHWYYKDKETVDMIDNDNIESNYIVGIAKLVDYINRNLESQKRHIKNINKFIFFGVALGIHLEEIAKKINPKICLIIESDLELFRLSLFTINYNKIFQKTQLIFSVADDVLTLQTTYRYFLQEQYIYNHNIKFNIIDNQYSQHIAYFQSQIVAQNHLSYPYNRHFTRALRPLNYWEKQYKFLNTSNLYSNITSSSKPIMVIAPGPSLQKNINWLKNNQNKFILIAVAAAINTLYLNNIKPDIVVSLEDKRVLESFPEYIDKSYYNDIIFITTAVTHKDLLHIFKKEKTFLIQAVCQYNSSLNQIFTPSVGEYAYSIALILGSKKQYLLGTDLAIDSETFQSHVDTNSDVKYFENIDEKLLDSIEDNTNVSLQDKFIKVKGNLRDFVFTTPLFNISINEYDNINKSLLKKDVEVYNLSDGAYLQGITPIKTNKLDTSKLKSIDKSKLHKNLLKDFDNLSTNKLSKNDLINLQTKLDNAKNILKIIKEHKINKSNTLNFHDYFIKLIILINTITKQSGNTKSEELNSLLSAYFKLTSHYIYEFFNTSSLKKEQKHIKKIDKIFIKQLERLVNYYIDNIEKISILK